VSNLLVTIERATYKGKQRVTLKRWDAETGEALPDVTLFDHGLNFRSISADKRHLLASRRDPSDSRSWEDATKPEPVIFHEFIDPLFSPACPFTRILSSPNLVKW